MQYSELKDKLSYLKKDILMNEKIRIILHKNITEQEKKDEIAKLIVDNDFFQPSIIKEKIGDYNFKQTAVLYKKNLEKYIPGYASFLEMKKEGLNNFKICAFEYSFKEGSKLFYKNMFTQKVYILHNKISYYEEKHTEHFKKISSDIEKNSTVKVLNYTNGDKAYVYKFNNDLIEHKIKEYVSAFMLIYNQNKIKTKTYN